MNKIFGQAIKIADANKMLTDVTNIKAKYNEKIKALTKDDKEATRFYCGGDCLYIFTKSTLKKLMDRIEDDDNDCLVIYHGSRSDEKGRPTLIASVYKHDPTDDKIYIVRGTSAPSDWDAFEHPGGNGKIVLQSVGTGIMSSFAVLESIKVEDIQLAFS